MQKKKQKTRSKKQKIIKVGNFKIKKDKLIVIICILVIFTSSVTYRLSDYWPWPSQAEIDQRLADVVNECIYNEDSRACRNIQNRYNMEFKYCYALSDIPEIDETMPIYGVAQKKDFYASSLNYEPGSEIPNLIADNEDEKALKLWLAIEHGNYSPARGIEGDSKYPYYGCAPSIDEVSRQKGSSLISNPDTIALYGLSQIPKYYADYTPNGQYGCTFHLAYINNLWEQVPNISLIKNEADNIFNMYPKCSMKANADKEINDLNTKISNYANSYSVQLFYQKYDEWNSIPGLDLKCTWGDKTFTDQRCFIFFDFDDIQPTIKGLSLDDFSNEMFKYLHTNYFTSKIVISN